MSVDTGEDDWKEWRRQGLGGSDVSAILGRHPHKGPWDLFLDKRDGVEQKRNAAMDFGNDLERPIAEWAKRELKGDDLVSGGRLEAQRGPLRGTPDFWLLLPEHDAAFGLECKTARYPNRDGWTHDGVPEHYLDQCQVYMLLSGRPVWFLAVWWLAAYERRIYVIHEDAERQGEIAAAASQWWHRHMVEGQYPEADASRACATGLRMKHPKHSGTMRVASDAEEEAVRVLAELDQSIDALETNRDRLRNYLRTQIGDDEGIRFTGGWARWNRPSNRLTMRIRE